jgi:hypothetical protein
MEKAEAEVMTFCDALVGAAFDPFLHDEQYPQLEHSHAKSIAGPTIRLCFDAIHDEFLEAKIEWSCRYRI